MRVFGGSIVLSAAAIVLSGCATSGALRRATEQQQAALAAQQTAQQAALASEKAERAASDSALRQDLGMVRGDITALRTELQTLRTEFGAKIAMVEEGLSLRSRERLEMLAVRDDVVLLHRDLVDGVQGVLDALFGMNRVWCPHPHHKWLDWEATLLPTKPDRLVERVRALMVAPPAEIVTGLGSLVDDTLDLCEKNLPEADVATLRHDFDHRRITSP